MITGKDVRTEVKKAEQIVADEKSSTANMFQAVVKLISVAIKILLNNRLNIVRIMENLKIAKITSDTQKEAQTEEEKK